MKKILFIILLALQCSCQRNYKFEDSKINWTSTVESAIDTKDYFFVDRDDDSKYYTTVRSITEYGDTIMSEFSKSENMMVYQKRTFPGHKLNEIREMLKPRKTVDYGDKYFYTETPEQVTIYGEKDGNAVSYTFHIDRHLIYILFETSTLTGDKSHCSFNAPDIEKLGLYTFFCIMSLNLADPDPSIYNVRANMTRTVDCLRDLKKHNYYR